jgi:hypothetical protein
VTNRLKYGTALISVSSALEELSLQAVHVVPFRRGKDVTHKTSLLMTSTFQLSCQAENKWVDSTEMINVKRLKKIVI